MIPSVHAYPAFLGQLADLSPRDGRLLGCFVLLHLLLFFFFFFWFGFNCVVVFSLSISFLASPFWFVCLFFVCVFVSWHTALSLACTDRLIKLFFIFFYFYFFFSL